ncbi:uncharacterized protein LOC143899581 isoform X2 [Temnothorax americanus]|uniref:uncharacterized protein LOC143899581 isoform X2 n=1 Tax=Temnothorax americanus TaxID=1964332 RepID=UPI0040691753
MAKLTFETFFHFIRACLVIAARYIQVILRTTAYYTMPTHSSKLDVPCEPEKLFEKDMDNKLPLKKRLKARAMMSTAYEKKLDVPCEPEKLFEKDMENKLLVAHAAMSMAYEKVSGHQDEKMDNYPGISTMSVATFETIDGTQERPAQIIKSSYELSSEEDNPHGSYHFNSNIVRRDYHKDMHISNTHNLAKESTRNHERQFRPNGDQPNAVCLESCQDRTPAQRRDVTNPTSLKRIATEAIEQNSACRKAKKTQSSIRQTRISKTNVPKVNYCYIDVDPEWNPSGESIRRRKKPSRRSILFH